MMDYSSLIIEIPLIREVFLQLNQQLEIFGLQFDPVLKSGVVVKYVCHFKNLRLTIRGQELIIQNSLCKFYHGYNDVNFSFTDFLQAKTLLEEQLGISLDEAFIRTFEYGVVIKVAKPSLTCSSLGMYKNRKPQEMSSGGSVYGVYYENSTHSLKIYDKTFEAKRNGYNLDYGLLRIEKKVSRSHLNSSPRFKNNHINTFGDLCRRNTFQLLGDDLVQSLTKIEINDIGFYSDNLSVKDLRLLGYMQNYPVRTLIKQNHSESYKDDMKRYREIIRDRQLNNHANFIQKVIEVLDMVILN